MDRPGKSFPLLALALIASLCVAACSRSGPRYYVVLTGTSGLRPGAAVNYAGVPVGKVEGISLRKAGAGAASQVIATLVLKPGDYQVRQGDRFLVKTAGLLGEEYIDIQPVSRTSPPLPTSATVQGELPISVFHSLKELSTFFDLKGLLAKLDALPEEKRQELLKTFRQLADQAAAATPGPAAHSDAAEKPDR